MENCPNMHFADICILMQTRKLHGSRNLERKARDASLDHAGVFFSPSGCRRLHNIEDLHELNFQQHLPGSQTLNTSHTSTTDRKIDQKYGLMFADIILSRGFPGHIPGNAKLILYVSSFSYTFSHTRHNFLTAPI
jgi:hypothetical protein